ncbi:MAG: acyl-CoA dehydrogenase, partial [Myxococcales bacterium]|nr:acyl-CoA dehydrogenase [Myxococcales bacterium]
MERHLFSEEHEIFRSNFRKFIETRVLPKQAKWREQGVVDREIWLEAGEAGFLCPWMEEEYGGAGGDFLHSVIVMEELSRAYESGWAASLHSDIIVPYVHAFGSAEQKSKWLPGCVSGQTVTALAMTEPGTGSDVAGIATTAKRDGDEYVINGAKTFISNGMSCDLAVVAARTANSDDPHRSVSLFVIEADAPGFIRSRKLEKMGMESQDTAELAFDDCRIPAENLLGQEGMGFMMLMQQL